MKNRLYVRTQAQKILWEKEIAGQLSDGMWENDFTDRRCWDCEVIVSDLANGFNFAVKKMSIDLTDLDFLYDRMLDYVHEVFPEYTQENLMEDLHELQCILNAPCVKGESLEEIEAWLDQFSLDKGVDPHVICLPGIPYTYHTLYAELTRKA